MGGADVGGSGSAKSEPNVVPLCDILLVLLIIFMVVTPIIKKGVNVTLPEAANTQIEPEPGKMITVYIKDDGSVFLDDAEITDLQKLAGMIEEKMEDSKNQEEKTKVLMRADANTKYGRVTAVMDEIRRAQIEFVGLITEKATAD